MNPKEKAREMYFRFYPLTADGAYNVKNSTDAKKCALICLDYVIDALSFIDNKREQQWWNEVKNQIEKN